MGQGGTLSCEVVVDETVKHISKIFDYSFDGVSTFTPPLIPELPSNFSVGLIVGPSGSGKSTVLRQFGAHKAYNWDPTKAICSQFASIQEAQDRLTGVGLNSIPSWMRPYHVLSTGEQFRADMAQALENNAVIDEFTSVVDRNVARACASAIRRYVDSHQLSNLVLASCHYDIIDWLRPDWVFDTSSGRLAGRGSQRRPDIVLEMLPCSYKAWNIFREHHYLTSDISKSSQNFLFTWNDNPIGFVSVLAFPTGHAKNAWREHRVVVLPDFQGLGIGPRISDATGELFIQFGRRYFSKAGHPKMGGYRNASPLWRATSRNNQARRDYVHMESKLYDHPSLKSHAERICFSHEYIGHVPYSIDDQR